MIHLPNNLTFAIIVKDVAWRADLTIRFAEYFSNKINGEDFIKKIIYPESIDQALVQCKTDYLLVMSNGFIPFNMSFFRYLDETIENGKDMFIGYMELAEDYVILNDKCLYVNMLLWDEVGKPMFKSEIREGDKFIAGDFLIDNKKPFFIDSAKEEKIYVPHEASNQGAAFIVKQLERFTRVNSFEQLKNKECFFLDTQTPYHEIHSETLFEKAFLPVAKKEIHLLNDEDLSSIDALTASVVVCSAQGLRANILTDHFKPELTIVYDNNPLAIEFQKLIFGITEPTMMSILIDKFKQSYPAATFADGWEIELNNVAVPIRNTKVRFEIVDAVSYEMEDLIKSINHAKSMIFDISDIFTYPYNFYRRPLYQVEGLFTEIYSLLKSRAGATYILGQAPGFQSLNDIEVNTSKLQYEADASVDPYAYDEETEEPPVVPPIMYLTPHNGAVIVDEDVKHGWLSAVRKTFSLPKKQIIEVIKEVIVERIVEKEVLVERFVDTPIEQPKPIVIDESMSPIECALANGYAKNFTQEFVGQDFTNLIVLSKEQKFEEFDAVYYYYVNEANSSWSFKLGKVGSDRKIEFSNGLTGEGMIKHMTLDVKVNPKTAVRYFNK